MNADIGSLMHLLASGVASRDKLTELAILSINSKSCFSIFNAILARRLLDLRNVDLLVAAAEASDTRFLSALLDAGASMDTKLLPRLSESLLHVASSCSPAATAMLLKRGANPNTLDFSHARPLHAVCSRNFDIEKKIDAIKLLLAAGADVNAPTKDGRTALHCALRFNVAWDGRCCQCAAGCWSKRQCD
jgi:hypothetical protein